MSDEKSYNPQTARSYKAGIVDDNLSLHINAKWLLQGIVLIAGLVYTYNEITQSIRDNDRRIDELEQRVADLKSIHDAEMKEIEAWYKKKVQIDLNPLNIFGKQKQK